jgi:hypothetical protein
MRARQHWRFVYANGRRISRSPCPKALPPCGPPPRRGVTVDLLTVTHARTKGFRIIPPDAKTTGDMPQMVPFPVLLHAPIHVRISREISVP